MIIASHREGNQVVSITVSLHIFKGFREMSAEGPFTCLSNPAVANSSVYNGTTQRTSPGALQNE
jgi:hypothetical protein